MNVYEARHAGREYCCSTEGSDHYKEGGLEPLDLMIAKGLAEDFCIGNISKYAFRFKKTRNPDDLKKVSDYAHILCGIELNKSAADIANPITDKPVEPWGGKDFINLSIFCRGENCAECPIPNYANGSEMGCSDWCKSHPAEARKIMDEMEE